MNRFGPGKNGDVYSCDQEMSGLTATINMTHRAGQVPRWDLPIWRLVCSSTGFRAWCSASLRVLCLCAST
jgi:hypothetical protein